MEFSPKDKDRLKRVLLIGSATVAVGATVKYIWDNEETTIRGFAFRLNRDKDLLFGAYRDPEKTSQAQISGGINDDLTIELDDPAILPEDIPLLEEVAELAKAQSRQSA